jgi:AcrR family transcriptional regulator
VTVRPGRQGVLLEKRPLRRDAAAHREQLLDAAAQVFATRGLEASVEEVARVAGVGIGTLYRRFPTKEALIEELVRQQLADIIAAGAVAQQLPGGAGLEAFLWRVGDLLAARRGCLARLWTAANTANLIDDARRLMRELLADSQQHGRIRPDVVVSDISLVIWSLMGVIDTAQTAAPRAWRRALEVLLAGLRPSETSLAEPAPTPRQIDAIVKMRSSQS